MRIDGTKFINSSSSSSLLRIDAPDSLPSIDGRCFISFDLMIMNTGTGSLVITETGILAVNRYSETVLLATGVQGPIQQGALIPGLSLGRFRGTYRWQGGLGYCSLQVNAYGFQYINDISIYLFKSDISTASLDKIILQNYNGGI